MSLVRFLVALSASALPLALLAGSPADADAPSDRTAQARAVPTQLLDVRDLPTGAPPKVAWSEENSRTIIIHGPDGSTTPAPKETDDFAPMGSGYVTQHGMRWPRVTWIDADGTPADREWRTTYGLAVSAGGEAVAFTGRRGAVRVIDSDGDRVLRMPRIPGGRSMPSVLLGEDCKESGTSTGCSVFVNEQARARSWMTTSHGIVDAAPFRSTTTGRGRWLGGITKAMDDGTCSVMRRGARRRWATCHNVLSRISPDRSHVLGTPAYADGLGPGRLDLLDLRTGRRLRSWTGSRTGDSATYFEETWEDPEHVLIVTLTGESTWAVVRLGLDGTMEYAVPPRRVRPTVWMPFHLQAS